MCECVRLHLFFLWMGNCRGPLSPFLKEFHGKALFPSGCAASPTMYLELTKSPWVRIA